MPMGEMIKLMLTRLEWFETRSTFPFFSAKLINFCFRFPRIAVNHEKIIRDKLDERAANARLNNATKAAATNSQKHQVKIT